MAISRHRPPSAMCKGHTRNGSSKGRAPAREGWRSPCACVVRMHVSRLHAHTVELVFELRNEPLFQEGAKLRWVDRPPF